MKYLVWVEESKIKEVLEILCDHQVYLGDIDQYCDYEKIIKYFEGLKKTMELIRTKQTRGMLHAT